MLFLQSKYIEQDAYSYVDLASKHNVDDIQT